MAPREFRRCATRVAGTGDAADHLPVQVITAHVAAFPARLAASRRPRQWPPLAGRSGALDATGPSKLQSFLMRHGAGSATS